MNPKIYAMEMTYKPTSSKAGADHLKTSAQDSFSDASPVKSRHVYVIRTTTSSSVMGRS